MVQIYTLDIETKPLEVYSWGLWDQNHGINQIIEHGGLMMFAAKKYGEKTIEAHCEWDGYGPMVDRLWDIYNDADYIVTYNGASFDNKYIARAFAETNRPPPSPHRDIDLLKTVRKRFAFPSKKLQYVCSALGLDPKTDPGGFETWTQILRPTSEAQQLAAKKRMVKYCRNDVKITEQLFTRLLPWVDGLNIPLYDTSNGEMAATPSCTRCGSNKVQTRGWAYTTTYRYRRYHCQSCGGWMKSKRSEPTPTELRNV